MVDSALDFAKVIWLRESLQVEELGNGFEIREARSQ